MSTLNEIAERERQFLLQTYNRYPVVLTRGKGVFVWDAEGRRYLDFVAGLGVNALGHAHPRIVKVIREQARLIHVSNLYYNDYQGLLAEKLCSLSGLQKVFFSNSVQLSLPVLLGTALVANQSVSWSRWKAPIMAGLSARCH
jgi:acetylornithine/N-succinyldiaminopimelate aminotransferase